MRYTTQSKDRPDPFLYKAGDIMEVLNPEAIVKEWRHNGEDWVEPYLTSSVDPVTGVVEISAGATSALLVGSEVFPQHQTLCPQGATTDVFGQYVGIGDVLAKLDVVVNTSGATATVSIQDGAEGNTYTLSPSGGFPAVGVVELSLGYTATQGPWRVTCGTGVHVIGSAL